MQLDTIITVEEAMTAIKDYGLNVRYCHATHSIECHGDSVIVLECDGLVSGIAVQQWLQEQQ
jgi:hypothetical protein